MSLMDRWLSAATSTRGGYPAGDKTPAELNPPPPAACVKRADAADEFEGALATLREVKQILRDAADNASKQIDLARSEAILFRARSMPEHIAAELAENRWRDRNPGLVALMDYVKGGA